MTDATGDPNESDGWHEARGAPASHDEPDVRPEVWEPSPRVGFGRLGYSLTHGLATGTLIAVNAVLAAIAVLALVLAYTTVEDGFWQETLMELGAGAILFMAITFGTPRMSIARCGRTRFIALLLMLALVAVAMFVGASWVEADYWQSLLIEFGAAILIFIALEVALESLTGYLYTYRRAARREVERLHEHDDPS